jgi:hypothetical protein
VAHRVDHEFDEAFAAAGHPKVWPCVLRLPPPCCPARPPPPPGSDAYFGNAGDGS